MKCRVSAAVTALFLTAVIFFSQVPSGLAEDTALTYQLTDLDDGTVSHTLNLVISQSLLEYYQGLSHSTLTDRDFPKYVTPYAMKPIANILREVYPEDEDFANGVLVLVHQITYEGTLPQFYAAEGLVRNEGDCDVFSVIAASILKAGGLSVVLLHYKEQEHMNIGIHLSEAPKDARSDVYSLKHRTTTYYVAETTSSNWKIGWRVGECPEDLKDTTASIITLENAEKVSPGQVSASLKKLVETCLTVDISPGLTTEGSSIIVHGKVSPALANENITLYLSANGSPWTLIGTALTQADGQFTYQWKAQAIGLLDLRASWSGNDVYAGTTSQARNAMVFPFYLLALFGLAISGITVSAVMFKINRSKRKRQTNLPAPTPEMKWV